MNQLEIDRRKCREYAAPGSGWFEVHNIIKKVTSASIGFEVNGKVVFVGRSQIKSFNTTPDSKRYFVKNWLFKQLNPDVLLCSNY